MKTREGCRGGSLLGYASHPIQDMTGHGDDWVKFSPQGEVVFWSQIPNAGVSVWNHGGKDDKFTGPSTGADKFASTFVKEGEGITYYHWDDVIWARDLTYDMIGRFFVKYGNFF